MIMLKITPPMNILLAPLKILIQPLKQMDIAFICTIMRFLDVDRIGTSVVEIHVSYEGITIREISRKQIFRDPNEDSLCVD